MNYRRLYSHLKDVAGAVLYDLSIMLNNYYSSKDYPIKMRRIKFQDAQTGKILIFLTNNFDLKATEIAQLYKHRWKIELFLNGSNNILRSNHFGDNLKMR